MKIVIAPGYIERLRETADGYAAMTTRPVAAPSPLALVIAERFAGTHVARTRFSHFAALQAA